MWRGAMLRTLLTGLVLSWCLLFAPSTAWAGSYLNRAALLLDAAAVERDMARPHGDDKELMQMVHAIAEARLGAARRTTVPPAIASAHPHLLLALENTERAYAAALAGQADKFISYLDRARNEDSTFRSLVAERGFSLPPAPPSR